MSILIDAMPMKAGRLIAKIVMDSHNKAVVQVHVYLWAGPLAINTNHGSGEAIRTGSDPVNAPVIVDGLCQCDLAASKQKNG